MCIVRSTCRANTNHNKSDKTDFQSTCAVLHKRTNRSTNWFRESSPDFYGSSFTHPPRSRDVVPTLNWSTHQSFHYLKNQCTRQLRFYWKLYVRALCAKRLWYIGLERKFSLFLKSLNLSKPARTFFATQYTCKQCCHFLLISINKCITSWKDIYRNSNIPKVSQTLWTYWKKSVFCMLSARFSPTHVIGWLLEMKLKIEKR